MLYNYYKIRNSFNALSEYDTRIVTLEILIPIREVLYYNSLFITSTDTKS